VAEIDKRLQHHSPGVARDLYALERSLEWIDSRYAWYLDSGQRNALNEWGRSAMSFVRLAIGVYEPNSVDEEADGWIDRRALLEASCGSVQVQRLTDGRRPPPRIEIPLPGGSTRVFELRGRANNHQRDVHFVGWYYTEKESPRG
jgi:hypothetical protein